MEPFTVLGAIAGVAGVVVAIVIAVVLNRRQFPKRSLMYSVEVIPLLNTVYGGAASGVSVALRGRPIVDAHVVSIQVWSDSRADISSGSFDNGDPITFNSDVSIIPTGWTARSDTSIGTQIPEPASIDQGVKTFHIPPQLIRRGARGAFAGIAEGKPRITTSNSLVDIKLVDADEKGPRTWWRTYGPGVLSMTVIFLTAVVAVIVPGFIEGLTK